MCWGPTPGTFPYSSPTRQHTSSPHTLSHTPPHSPHTLSHTSPLPTHLSLPHPSTFPYISPYIPHTSSHSCPDLPLHPNTLPHSPHSLSSHLPPQFRLCGELPCDNVALINLTGLWKSPIKFVTTTANLKSCFGVGNANFRCMKVWRSYHVAKLLATVAKY